MGWRRITDQSDIGRCGATVRQFDGDHISDQMKHALLPASHSVDIICHTSMEPVAAHFVCLRWVLPR